MEKRRDHELFMRAYKGEESALNKIKTNRDILKEHHRFLIDDDEMESAGWELRMVKKYHDHLYKEYCLADLSRVHGPGSPIGLRWRTEKEVVEGRGQYSCGSLQCGSEDSLCSWELPFGYTEAGEKKMALVKLTLCPDCSVKLPSRKRKPWTDK